MDLYGKPEILFFGPDEGTADMMDWAACKSHGPYASSFVLNTTFRQCTHGIAVPRPGGSRSQPARAPRN